VRKGSGRVAARKTRRGAAGSATAAAGSVLLVNIVPRSLSFESNQDSEPMLTVNPRNPNEIVATAFTPDPMGSGLAPYFVSSDGGRTWVLNAVVPGGNQTSDITAAFSGTGSKLYAGILRQDSPDPDITRQAILRTNQFNAPTALTVLDDRQQPDQPFIQAMTVASGADQGKERIYVGSNDFGAGSRSATLDIGLDAGSAAPTFKRARIEHRVTAGQNGPQIRPAVHPDGTVYAAFLGWRSQTGNFSAGTLRITADVVVVRDDSGGKGAQPCEDLKDPADGQVGMRAARGIRFGFDRFGLAANGQQRLGGALSIAVDPRAGQSGRVYLAWGTVETASGFTVHVRRSQDRGVTWSAADLLTLARTTNPALAINNQGVIGLLYQQLTGTGQNLRWETHFRRTTDGTIWSDLTLASTPASRPPKDFDPYLGDYDHLVAVGRDFFGIFSANNTPDRANFPNGVVYQRNADFNTRRLLGVNGQTTVATSMDPFFFRVSG